LKYIDWLKGNPAPGGAKRLLSLCLVFSLLIVQGALIIPAPVLAADPPLKGIDAPLNPDFESWLQQYKARIAQKAARSANQTIPQSLATSDHPLGLIPRPADMRHLDRIPVTAEARLQNRSGARTSTRTLSAVTSTQEFAGPSGTVGVPATFDWRTRGMVTPVKNQGSCGTCWAFGTLASFESRVLVQDNPAYDFSEQNLVVCTDRSWTYLAADRCNAGGWDWLAVDTLTKKGARQEACDPYNTYTISSANCLDCTTVYRPTGFRNVASTAAGKEELIKDTIYNYGPVEAAFYYNSSYVYAQPPATSPRYIIHQPNSTNSRNHLICIVGWDDTFAYDGTVYGAWIIKNSWGTGWGQGGYCYMTYGSSNLGDVGFFSSVKASESGETIYSWDEAGYVVPRGYYDSSAWMANVFTASQAGSLTAVDFWTTSNNAQYLINVYNGPFGALLATQSGACAEQGYYSIPLTTAVTLTGSQVFTVAVKMTTPGSTYPLAVERAESGYCNPPIQTGVSYARHYDTDTWSDLGSTVQRNVCVRARVVAASPASQGLLIGPEDSTATGTTSPNYFILDRFAANSSGSIASIKVKCGASGNVKVAIYADSSGSPGALLNAANTGTAVTTGWNTISIPSTAVTAGTYYWLAFIMDASCVSYKQEGSTTRWFKTVSYSGFTFPSSAGSGFTTVYTAFYDFITGWSTIGSTADGRLIGPVDSTATGTTSPNYFILDRFAANSTGSIASIKVKCGASGNVKVAIYADSSGSPGALLNAANTGTAVTTGWNTISIPSTAVTAGTYYWLAFIMDTSCVSYKQEGSTTRWFKTVSYSGFTFPSSAGSGFTTVYTAYYDFITGWSTSADARILGPEDSTATGTTPPNYFILDRFAANSTGSIASIKVKCGASGNVKVAIYADSSGSPGALLNAVNTGTAVTTGWNTISIPSTAVTAGTYYWLAYIMDTSCVNYKIEGSTARWFKTVSYSGFTFPSSAGSGFTTGYTAYYDFITGWGS
jgi:C1A family cysteine protease